MLFYTACFWLGVAVIAHIALKSISAAYVLLHPSKLSKYRNGGGKPSWALITGSSDGIGYGLAQELLARGFNVLLHGRNEDKLRDRVRELQARYPKAGIDYVIADASAADDAYLAVVRKAQSLQGQLKVVINNVGGQTMTPQFATVWQLSHTDIDITMNMNLRFSVHLTKAVFPLLKENAPSLILNCGSTGGLLGVPYLAVYTASKAFIHTFTKALKNDLIAEDVAGVDTMGFMIGNTDSNTNKEDIPFFTVSSRECAAACLDRVGCGRTLVVPHWRHQLQVFIGDLMSDYLQQRVLADQMRQRMERERRKT